MKRNMLRRAAAALLLLTLAFSCVQAQGAVAWGSRGNDVSRVQSKLKQYGYYSGAVDGIFGQGTYNSVVQFQRQYGLAPDGIVGRDTWNKLQAVYNDILRTFPGEFSIYDQYARFAYPGYNLLRGSTGSAVRNLQEYLQVLSRGVESVPYVAADGIFGAATAAAVRTLQSRLGYSPTGAVGPVLWSYIITQGQGYGVF